MEAGDAKATIARRLRTQGRACLELGSPRYAELLERAARDVEDGGPIWDVLAGHEHDPGPSVLALRLLGAVHRLVLRGDAPDLARYYPSAGGSVDDGDDDEAWEAFRAVAANEVDHLRGELNRNVQTNEVGRTRALTPAFLLVARETNRPLRTLEVGASGGLNLRWDHFCYHHRDRTWGDDASPVQFDDVYEEGEPPFDVEATVVDRRGCDPHPVDPTTDDGALTLMSYAWPDQLHRFGDLRAAIDVARRVPATVDRAEAAPWIATQLAELPTGVTTIVYHSVVMQYLSEEGRAAFFDAVRAAGARATDDAPLAWVWFEPARRLFEVNVTLWPGGAQRHVADAGAHGRPVRWFAS